VHRLQGTAAVLAAALLAACAGGPDDDDSADLDPTPAPPGLVEVLDQVACGAPVDGFVRLQRGSVDRGLGEVVAASDTEPRPCPRVPGGLVASDLDDDGDVDLVLVRPSAFPTVLENVAGHFEEAPSGGSGLAVTFGRDTLAAAAVDLDGDRLPELILTGEGVVAAAPNLGGLQFGPLEPLVLQDEYPVTCFQSLAVGDVDGDGDLDLLLPGYDPVAAPGEVPGSMLPSTGTADLLLLRDEAPAAVGDGWSLAAELTPPPGPWLSMLAAFTDRDDDGDLDLLVMPDRSRDRRPGASFFRNDGLDAAALPRLVDDAEEIGADVHVCSMGLLSADLDDDGRLDYCISDVLSELRCLVADDLGYHEAGAALGLRAHPEEHAEWDVASGQWSPWSIEAVDLDADGRLDVVAAAGGPPGIGGVPWSWLSGVQPDAIWQGTADGFVDRTGEVGFGDGAWHYGLAAADLDRDGFPEIVIAPDDGPLVVWDNPCGAGAWLTVELDGPPGNRQGFGARVTVRADGRDHVRELHGLRTVGQGPAELRFGVGEATAVERLEVRWPDGGVTVAEDLPVRARLRVRRSAP